MPDLFAYTDGACSGNPGPGGWGALLQAKDGDSVVKERELRHAPEKVWRALTQAPLMEDWLMKNNFNLEVGHQFQLKGGWGGVLDCEVLAVDPHKSLTYSWNFQNDDPAFALESTVTFTLTPTANGTHLRVEQAGFRPDQKQAFGGAHAGWKGFLENLDRLLGEID